MAAGLPQCFLSLRKRSKPKGDNFIIVFCILYLGQLEFICIN
jgi:hypothetical protein